MKKFNYLVLLMLLLLLMALIAGCKSKSSSSEEEIFELYYLDKDSNRLETVEYNFVNVTKENQVREALEAMNMQRNGVVVAKPENVKLVKQEIIDNTVYLTFDNTYNAMDNISEIFVRASIVLTLTQIEDIDYVGIYVNEQPLKDALGYTVGNMKSSDFVDKIGNTINNYDVTTITLYFANKSGNKLTSEIYEGIYPSNETLERFVVEKLINGPRSSDNYRTLPVGTQVLSVNTKDGICYVNLDGAFVDKITSVKADVMVYSIVNSLVELSYINKVQISIDGETDFNLYGKISLNQLFARNLALLEK